MNNMDKLDEEEERLKNRLEEIKLEKRIEFMKYLQQYDLSEINKKITNGLCFRGKNEVFKITKIEIPENARSFYVYTTLLTFHSSSYQDIDLEEEAVRICTDLEFKEYTEIPLETFNDLYNKYKELVRYFNQYEKI